MMDSETVFTAEEIAALDPNHPARDVYAKRHRSDKRFLLRVRCGGQYHSISWQPRGRFTIHDHAKEELRSLKTLAKLGDRSCQCLEVIRRFREDRRDSYILSKQAWKVPIKAAQLAHDLRFTRKRQTTEHYYARVNVAYRHPWQQNLAAKWHRRFNEKSDEARRMFVATFARFLRDQRMSNAYGGVVTVNHVEEVGCTFYWNEGEPVVGIKLMRAAWLRVHGMGLSVISRGGGGDGAEVGMFGLRLLVVKPGDVVLECAVPETLNGTMCIVKRVLRAKKLGDKWSAVECLSPDVEVRSPFGMTRGLLSV
jgi:hypothetical protein